MKKCNSCLNLLETSHFTKDNGKRDGFRTICRTCDCAKKKSRYICNTEKNQEIYKKNKEVVKARSRVWRANNLEISNKKARDWAKANPERRNQISRNFTKNNPGKSSEYKRKNSGKYAAHRKKYEASKINATPNWLTQFDFDYIESLYVQAKELKNLTGVDYHVDHILPLRGEIVCGLHVPWNLQVITAEENHKKNNRVNHV